MSKRKCLSVSEKVLVIQEVDKGVKKKDIAEKFGIPQSSLSTILKNRETILKQSKNYDLNRKKMKTCVYDDIDEAVMKWITVMREKCLPLSGPIIKEKALVFAAALGHHDFQASNGWMDKFKKRHNIIQKVISGECASVNTADCEFWKQTVLKEILDEYAQKDIFNADETGLFFKCLPNRTLTFKNDPCFGGKHSKQRITVLVAASMLGTEKLKLLVIGKSKSPRCFRGTKSLEVDYTFNKKAWMTSTIFTEWVTKLDKQMSKQKRKIALFVDNCTAHPHDINSKLDNIKVVFFPPNVTSVLQPMDQGVIQTLKLHYRKRILKKIVSTVEKNESVPDNIVDLRECISELAKVWTNDVRDTTVKNCFSKAGFNSATTESDEEDEIVLSELKNQWNFLQKSGNVTDEAVLEDFINVDDHTAVTDFQDDDDILQSIKPTECLEEEEEDDDDECDTPQDMNPTDNEILQSFKTIRRGLQLKDNVPDSIFECLNKCETFYEQDALYKCKVQQKITHFFK